uniref:Uncharacterized protein n=1 Tax=Podoviridae sp. ct8Lf7 TaxID=2827723 RepID=A0A8S5S0P9_9CAUD|nr:MAG TPA: hypothetical protein [Podoviridae sp. ct8Lf7]
MGQKSTQKFTKIFISSSFAHCWAISYKTCYKHNYSFNC